MTPDAETHRQSSKVNNCLMFLDTELGKDTPSPAFKSHNTQTQAGPMAVFILAATRCLSKRSSGKTTNAEFKRLN
jgi:hypothetical protein